MKKIITIPSSFEEIDKSLNIIDGFIIGIKNLSININLEINDLSILDKYKTKEIFVAINKNLNNCELDLVRNILIELNNYNIKGVIFYDIGLLNIFNNLNLNYELVWSQEHFTTNYDTINFWNDMGAKYTYLSSDITIDEVNDISKNTNSKLMLNLFGYLPMFASKRHIVKNYLNNFSLKDDSKINYIEKEENCYPIIDNEIGTICYSSHILNGIDEYLKVNVDYVVLNSFNIDINLFIEIIKLFKTVNEDNVLEYKEKIDSCLNTDKGFLNKSTIYKVKNNEK